MSDFKTAEKTGKVKQPEKLCPDCGKPIVPVMRERKMVWRHKLELSEECAPN